MVFDIEATNLRKLEDPGELDAITESTHNNSTNNTWPVMTRIETEKLVNIEGLDCSVTLPDSPTMFQQTRSSSPDLLQSSRRCPAIVLKACSR